MVIIKNKARPGIVNRFRYVPLFGVRVWSGQGGLKGFCSGQTEANIGLIIIMRATEWEGVVWPTALQPHPTTWEEEEWETGGVENKLARTG